MRVISEKSSKHSMIKSCMLKSPRICIFWVFFFVICTFLQLQWTNYKLVIKLSSLLKKEDIPYLMDSGDKSWMSFRRSTNEYISGTLGCFWVCTRVHQMDFSWGKYFLEKYSRS
ncbi:uncharacterized protein LOC107024437 isoform X3 [Solanum pennellii]|uniref:Uncharacterized protein LOC107024437 isoform X3 n=1 Tax=Solanum pennellii TaxID=28526 RepID=A0ABM1VF82_SOLPN|nr:uncharacterized protein LOC107024437 isoform X3 [Solanum pennellii]